MKDKLIKELVIELLTGLYGETKTFTECHTEFLTGFLLAEHGPKLINEPVFFLINAYSMHSFFEIEYNLRQRFL